ncbi:hypothetical protein [Pseudomonas rossensis]|uniref:hypothetical protein n=1 Tax=Pseudomonas rossensis TaxID=2305471 RepID=UPI003261A46F
MKLFWLLSFLMLGACGDAGRESGTPSVVVENHSENDTALVSQEIPDFSDQEPVFSLRAGGDEWDLGNFTSRALILPGIVDLGQVDDLWMTLFPRTSLIQVKILAGPDSPVKHVNMAVVFSTNPVPAYFETDARGESPEYYVQTGIVAKVYFVWDELVVPEGADDYEKSRNKGLLPTLRDWSPGETLVHRLLKLTN